jgi:hypothetical protein
MVYQKIIKTIFVGWDIVIHTSLIVIEKNAFMARLNYLIERSKWHRYYSWPFIEYWRSSGLLYSLQIRLYRIRTYRLSLSFFFLT